MVDLNRETIKKLTVLSCIECLDEEQEALLHDLQKILAFFEQLTEVDTEGVPPCNHVLEGMTNVTREDVIGEVMPRDVFLANAPSHSGGLVKVPTIIKGI